MVQKFLNVNAVQRKTGSAQYDITRKPNQYTNCRIDYTTHA